MPNNKKVVVVLPAYNAARTLADIQGNPPRDRRRRHPDGRRQPRRYLRAGAGARVYHHAARHNRGYGGNQKTCYTAALARGADIVVMLHPDYQYTPKLVAAMASMIAYGEFDAVLGSRILGRGRCGRHAALQIHRQPGADAGGKHAARAQDLGVSHRLPGLEPRGAGAAAAASCSDDFVFDNQMLAQAIYFGFRIGEISCPTKYFAEASSINFRRSVTYGLGVLRTALNLRLKRWGLAKPAFLEDVPLGRLPAGGAAPHSISSTLG